ncbi:GDP-fucose protein O-fucosyltransferase [Cynara cardunculus var. scolymus]|uniref:O-fucosyltransferase family protein n=1 Tax=Cynara cardunculus var. scolymus TaxID=59895 RepID=A0A103XZD1_CYNCS|nr:GDP-fucose protein O-fucosyltransferase [Cynara cardunculus var. scolymus]
MKLQYLQTQAQRAAFAGIFVILLPNFFPNLFDPLGRAYPSMFSEWNAPSPKHVRLLEGAVHQQISEKQQTDIWSPLAYQGWKPCLDSARFSFAVAKILNATLVIPHLDVNPVWQDSSSFTDIFDVDHFIEVLHDEVSIVKELPSKYAWSTREYYATGIRATRIKTAPVHASAKWYLENVLPMLNSHGIAAIAPFSHRLAFDNLPKEIQLLRCKVNFQALSFVPHIRMLGDTLVQRLRSPPNAKIATKDEQLHEKMEDKLGSGKFIVLHLRFDKDMAAHSACDFGGGKAEKLALAKYRQVYGGEARISTLRKLFPLMEDKKSLASDKERAEVEGKASLLAAVDYYVTRVSSIQEHEDYKTEHGAFEPALS